MISAAGFTPAAAAAFAADTASAGCFGLPFHVGIDDHLVVVAEIHRLELLKLLAPLLHVADVSLVALQIIGRTEFDQHVAVRDRSHAL